MPRRTDSDRPAGLDPAFGDYSPPTAGTEAAPLPILDAWYATYPSPALEGIFAAGVTELVFGSDERQRVEDTTIAPFRWIAMLEITASDGSRWRGTGWLVSPSLVATAGHCVHMAARGGWASSIRVRFGVRADDTGNILAEAAPAVTATRFRSVAGWVQNQDPHLDYGALLLPVPVPADFGHFLYEARTDSALTAPGALFNLAGYPADKPAYQQWFYARYSAGVTPTTVTYTADSYGGQSGGPIYDYNGGRTCIGVHVRGSLISNEGIRITNSVASNLQLWSEAADRT